MNWYRSVRSECYYINCPAKIGVYVADKDHVYLVDSGNLLFFFVSPLSTVGGNPNFSYSKFLCCSITDITHTNLFTL